MGETQARAGREPAVGRHAGRPRSPEVDEAIMRATLALLIEGGIEGTTMSAVVARSGVARGTVYLRWPNRQTLIAAAVRQAMGREVMGVTGEVEADMRRAADQVQGVLSQPMFQTVFPAVVSGLIGRERSSGLMSYATIAPGREAMVAEYEALARSAGLRDDVPGDLVTDLVIGGLLNHLLATGEAPTAEEAAQVVDIILEGVRRRDPA